MTDPDAATAAAKRAILMRTRSTEWTTLTLRTVDLVAMLAVDAARPVIEAEATARERQRIRDDGDTVYWRDGDGLAWYKVAADLLDGDGAAEAATPDDREAEFNRYAYDEGKFRP